MDKKLEKISGFAGIEGPVLTIVMDGVGIAPANAANAVAAANKKSAIRFIADFLAKRDSSTPVPRGNVESNVLPSFRRRL